MFSLLSKFFKVAQKPPQLDPNLCYYGGPIDADDSGYLWIAVFKPAPTNLAGLVFNAYEVRDKELRYQFSIMPVGEGFYLDKVVHEEEIAAISRFKNPTYIRIAGKNTEHPDAPIYPILKL